jgi:hypothetical protein
VVPFIKIYREHLAEIFVAPLHEFGSFEVCTGYNFRFIEIKYLFEFNFKIYI